ncbi:MAG: phosphate/phosphite/phosphonate ABC transporter substrate-binding protein [Nitrospirae bacterium]|nr:phosphate/phosphite/phosphonate ABC transporter substrate-binding protein [Nitrospirota bacterium]
MPLLILLLFALSCSRTSPAPEQAKAGQKKVREGSFVIAILPEQNVFEQKRRYKPLAEYLSNALNTNVKIKLLDSYGAIYDEIKNGNIDGAFFGSFNYVVAKARMNIEPIARPVEMDGSSSYRSVIFARTDARLTPNISTWRGKRLALVHEVTTAGYIFPRWYLRRHGANNFDTYFGRIIFTGSHDAAVIAVYKGYADLGAAKDDVYKKILAENPAIRGEISIIANSIEVPSNSLCVRGDLNPSSRETLKKILLSMHKAPGAAGALKQLEAISFTETTDAEFDALRKMTQEVGIDPLTYHFKDIQ